MKEKETIEKLLNAIFSSIEDASSEIDELKDKIDLYDDLCDFLLDLSCREDCPEDVIKQAHDLYMRI